MVSFYLSKPYSPLKGGDVREFLDISKFVKFDIEIMQNHMSGCVMHIKMTRRVESNRLKLFDSKSNTERVVIQIQGVQRRCMTNDISF